MNLLGVKGRIITCEMPFCRAQMLKEQCLVGSNLFWELLEASRGGTQLEEVATERVILAAVLFFTAFCLLCSEQPLPCAPGP